MNVIYKYLYGRWRVILIMGVAIRHTAVWVAFEGEVPSFATHRRPTEEVLNEHVAFDINALPLQDLNVFVSGQIHDHLFY